jgi:hypothetical protein
MNAPFEYPAEPLVRKHGPRGYGLAESFKPWLRDDFSFRCVFCLIRETWLADQLEVDHFVPVASAPEVALDYTNLTYACRTCNGKKGSCEVPDPCAALVREEISLGSAGFLVGGTPRARKLIQSLALNSRRQREYRVVWMKIIALAELHDPPLYRRLVGYPDDLPDLSRLHPPEGNSKPEGIVQSCYERRARGVLPDTY